MSGNPDNTPSRVTLEKKYKLEFGVDPEFMKKVNRVRELLSTRHPRGMKFEKIFEILMDEYIERNSPDARMRRRKTRASKAEKSQKTTNGAQAARGNDHGAVKERGTGTEHGCGKECGNGNEDRRGAENRPQAKNSRTNHGSVSDGRWDVPEKSRFITRAVRDEVFTRDGDQCTFVGQDGTSCESRWNLEIDHIVPYSRGGGNKAGNLRLLCPEHNRLEAERAYGKEFMQRYYRTE